jgi:predicted ATPase/DNA-binding SARP family transcriptional activator
MEPRWTIRLFAGLGAEAGGQLITRFPTRKTGLLLAFLAYHLPRAQSRDALIDLLWPDLPPPSARNSLSKALSSLRRLLEASCAPGTVLLATHAGAQLDPATVTTDVAQFEAALQAAARASDRAAKVEPLTEAMELYRGELLPGCHEPWVMAPREWLAESYFQALRELIGLLEEEGELGRALTYARRGVFIDGLREEARRDVMRLYAVAGQREAALRQYQELARLLKAELEAEPSAETRALAEQIKAEQNSHAAAPPSVIGARKAPPLASLRSCPHASGTPVVHNLPAPVTSFVGREREMAEVRQLLAGSRLLTLTGTAGSGKTRLALETAARLLDDFPDGVYFVELAPIRDPDLVVATIAQTLGVGEVGDRPLCEILKSYLREKQLLLVLDNFEQVISAALSVTELLAAAARLKVIVTSREVLRLRGEQDFPVPPLQAPDPQRLPPLPALSEYAALKLFVQRAGNVQPDFVLDHVNAAAVAEICFRLDGLPLAIELAAARVRLFSPQALLPRLQNRLQLLTDGARDLPARQQTLRNTIAWSYDLLDEGEQVLFRRLAVFAGGFTLEAAEAICGAGGNLGVAIADGIAALADKNLLRRHELSGGMPRFGMLETMREYARERLAESGETDAISRHHAEYFLELAQQAEPYLMGPTQGEWLEHLEREHDNLREVLRWSEASGEPEAGARLSVALAQFWEVRGYWSEGRHHLIGFLSLTEASGRTAVRARALNAAARLASLQEGDAGARILYQESLSIWRELGDRRGVATSLYGLAALAMNQGDRDGSWALLQESLAIRQELGDMLGIAQALNAMGHVTDGHEWQRHAASRALYEKSLEILRTLESKQTIAGLLNNLARVVLEQGDCDTANAYWDESLTIARELGDKRIIASALEGLGRIAQARDDFAKARAFFEQGVAIWRELGNQRRTADLLARAEHLTRVGPV